ncbi:mechanosensitive ion channel family protein [Candidatus Saccharibacteria bacterium]|nr:mechanosensitive ion channel family protein [Candidatus Saccharibacteria bacterium]
MDFIKDIVENVWIQRAFWSVIVILFSLLIYHVTTKVLNSREQKTSKIMGNKKNKTIIRMLKSVIAGTLGIITVLMVLQIYGINVTSMLAGVGIASIVIGFALQDSLKDIIRGFVIVSDNYYEIGDVIKFGDNIGPVTSVSLLTTKIQDINTMNFVSIANRNVDKVEVDPGYVYIPIPLPLDLPVAKAEELMQDIIKKLHHHDGITSAAYQGITAISDSSLNYQIVITCDPVNKLQIRRDTLRVIATTLEEHKVHFPYTQLDLHTKNK